MFEVRWTNENGYECRKGGFKTSEEAHNWIRSHKFHKYAFPMVFGV